MAFSELRVHGMSGTPPRDLLYSDPVSYDRSDPYARIYESNRDGREVKAFHWGSLTSGSRITAFWLLLSPFMLANLAGWMASTKASVQAFIRLTGLFITGLLVAQLGVVFISHVNEIVDSEAYHDLAVAGGGFALALIFITILWRLSTQSLLEPMTSGDKFVLLFGSGEKSLSRGLDEKERQLRDRDPAPGATLADAGMWIRQPILDRLRRQHLAGGLLVIAVILELGLKGGPVLVAAFVVSALVVLDMALISVSTKSADRLRWASGANVHLALLVLIAAIAHVFIDNAPDGPWPQIHLLVFYIAMLAGISSATTLVAQFVAKEGNWKHAFLPTAALAIAASIGGALGVAAGLFAELASYRFLGPLNPFQVGSKDGFVIANSSIMVNGGAWTVESMLCFFMALIGFAAMAAWTGEPELPSPNEGRSWSVLRWVTSKVAIVFGSAGVIAAALALPAVYIACWGGEVEWCDPQLLQPDVADQVLPTIAGLLALFLIVALTYAVSRISRPLSAIIPPLGALALWLVWAESIDDEKFVWVVPLLDLPVRPTEFLDLAVVLIVFGLTFFILRSIIGGFGDPEKRRKVGMLWDTGSFWPRWFHPLAPPSYSPYAVKKLREALKSEGSEILTAHSQGSVIACVALSQSDSPLPNALLTYGSPLGLLYDKLFPYAGVRRLVSMVDARWGTTSHWVNLWRDTDPLGGAAVPCIGVNHLIRSGTGHSQYELTEEFFAARSEAIAGHVRGPVSGPGGKGCAS